MRPGRFDRHVALTLPDRAGRRDILALHAEGKPLAPAVDLDAIAALTRGFSGAEAHAQARTVITEQREVLEALATALLDQETLTGASRSSSGGSPEPGNATSKPRSLKFRAGE